MKETYFSGESDPSPFDRTIDYENVASVFREHKDALLRMKELDESAYENMKLKLQGIAPDLFESE